MCLPLTIAHRCGSECRSSVVRFVSERSIALRPCPFECGGSGKYRPLAVPFGSGGSSKYILWPEEVMVSIVVLP